jgi:hypothetical protein
MGLDSFIERHGETFDIERDGHQLVAKGLTNRDKRGRRFVSFYPGTDVQEGDALRGQVSGDLFKVANVERELMRGSVFQVVAYVEPERSPSPAIHVGSMVNSAIMQGSPNGVQTLTFTQQQRESVSEFVDALSQVIGQLHLSDDANADLIAELDTVKSQLKVAKPKASVISLCLKSIHTTLAEAAKSAAAAGAGKVASEFAERLLQLM